MPPWPPDNSCQTYQHDASLADDDRQKILAWIADDTPEGDPADAPEVDDTPADPIDFNVQLQLPEPFTPTIAPDEYRCFLLEWPEDETSYITAFTIVPGERQIVHHVIAFNIDPDKVADFVALDEADPDPGYLCYGGPGGEGQGRVPWLGGWVPGNTGGAMPEGTGLKIEPGSMVVVQMHYHTYPGAGPDQSKVLFRTAPSVERPAAVLPFTNPQWPQGAEPMPIPAGEKDVVHTYQADVGLGLPIIFPDGPFGPGDPYVIHDVGLHMHTRGTRGNLSIVGGDDECLLSVPRWDFNWQGNYRLQQPVTVQPGEELRIECHWDNSPENQPFENGVQLPAADIEWGEGTNDEMCLGILYISGV